QRRADGQAEGRVSWVPDVPFEPGLMKADLVRQRLAQAEVTRLRQAGGKVEGEGGAPLFHLKGEAVRTDAVGAVRRRGAAENDLDDRLRRTNVGYQLLMRRRRDPFRSVANEGVVPVF